MLNDAGAEIVASVASVKEALEAIESTDLDAALLTEICEAVLSTRSRRR